MPTLFQLIVATAVSKQWVAVLDSGREEECGMNALQLWSGRRGQRQRPSAANQDGSQADAGPSEKRATVHAAMTQRSEPRQRAT